uniref:DUF1409 domain-containing protein n=1 Tax=Oryza brachyantha TaxID=4533 RepID=J3M5I5_ORYBR
MAAATMEWRDECDGRQRGDDDDRGVQMHGGSVGLAAMAGGERNGGGERCRRLPTAARVSVHRIEEIQNQLPGDLMDAIAPAGYIECHAHKFTPNF